ncbi:MAG: DUF4177 domain-containing protein [Spirochaetota bacterium]|nr:DUF4177 domain-containing protein [Spirochaetota bacterium]
MLLLNCNSSTPQQGAKKWEYKVIEITFKNSRGEEPFLNEYGKAGWELIQKSGNEYIFKR